MVRSILWAGLITSSLALIGCGDDTSGASGTTQGSGANGSGASGQGGDGGSLVLTGGGDGQGANGAGGNDGCGSALTGLIRDFTASHPDFESYLGTDPGIVEAMLGADDKPVYAGQGNNPSTTGQANFDQWYRTVDGVNQAIPLTIQMTQGAGGVYTYDNGDFFPIDGQGFGDEGNPHNYHFTFELHTAFVYEGGEVFQFTGDDDLFTFINGHLAIDLGGVHGAMNATIDLDARAAELEITVGETYPLDFFFAERHTTESNFRIDTTIAFVNCGEIPD
jgi:fibro-slime domain-containing protein